MDDWRVVDGALSAWYDAPSHTAGAALAVPGVDAEVRRHGVRVRIPADRLPDGLALARQVSEVATEQGLRADPSALQAVRVRIDGREPAVLRDFWGRLLGYGRTGPDGLQDPLTRDPGFVVRQADQLSRARNRIHLDIARPADVVEQVKAALGQEPHGPYGLALADPEGNQLDFVPGDAVPGAEDWVAQFAAMTFYPASAPAELVRTVAELADATDQELLIDVRPDGVAIAGGKDLWETDEGEADSAFVALAQGIQQAAHAHGAAAEPDRLRFLQVMYDAADIPAVQGFWRQVLGYANDHREGLADLHDPHWLNPVVLFQQLDPADERLRERSRIFLELAVPADAAEERIKTALAAGGQILENAGNRCLVGDPEGNELAISWVE